MIILYSKTLHLKCTKWIKSALCCDCYTKINLFFYSAQLWAQKIGMPCCAEAARTLYGKYLCKNHFLETDFTTPEKKRLNRGQCHVAQTRLNKIQHRSFLILHSQIWIHYPQFYLPRRTFMSRHPVEPMASCLCPHALFRHLFFCKLVLSHKYWDGNFM